MKTLIEDEFDGFDMDRLYQEYLAQSAYAHTQAASAMRRAGSFGGRNA